MAATDPSGLVRNARALVRAGAAGSSAPPRNGAGRPGQLFGGDRLVPRSHRRRPRGALVVRRTGAGARGDRRPGRSRRRVPARGSTGRRLLPSPSGSRSPRGWPGSATRAAIAAYRAVLADEPGTSTAAIGLARALLGRADQMRAEAASCWSTPTTTTSTSSSSKPRSMRHRASPASTDGWPGRSPRAATGRARSRWCRWGSRTIPTTRTRSHCSPSSSPTEDGAGESLTDDERERLIDLVDLAVVADPDNGALLVRRARLIGNHGSPARAVEAWRAVVAREPDVAEWHRELGDHLAGAGDFEGAGAAYDRAVALGYDVY